MPMRLAKDRHPRSLLIGDLRENVLKMRILINT